MLPNRRLYPVQELVGRHLTSDEIWEMHTWARPTVVLFAEVDKDWIQRLGITLPECIALVKKERRETITESTFFQEQYRTTIKRLRKQLDLVKV